MYAPLADHLRPASLNNGRSYNLALILGGSLFIALTAQLALPIGPVPITGQTLGVLLVGMLLGSRRGSLAVLTYLAEGALGLPVFAGFTGGLAVLAGPTAGYLAGFVVAAFLVGWLAERGWDRRPLTTAAAMVLGNLAIYALGLLWLAQFTGWEQVLAFGFWPFLLGDGLKIIVAMGLLPLVWKRFS